MSLQSNKYTNLSSLPFTVDFHNHKAKGRLLFLFIVSFITINLLTGSEIKSQEVKDHTVRLSARWFESSDGQKKGIKLLWYPDKNAIDYRVFRKSLEANSFDLLNPSLGVVNSFLDTEVKENTIYEYKVEKIGNYADTAEYQVSGYITAYFQTPSDYNKNSQVILNSLSHKGNLLILVDNTVYERIKPKLLEYIFYLKLDGWSVVLKKTPRAEKYNPKAVNITKNIVMEVAKNTTIDNVLLLGRVPIQYSGNFAIDGHLDHTGAWPFDAYYGDLTNYYLDSINFKKQASDSRQFNLANDGKFDHTRMSNFIDLGVGRVDFYNLPDFKESEMELLIRYLDKDIKYRKGGFFSQDNAEGVYPEIAMINDGFGNDWRTKFAASAFNNFTPLVDWSLIEADLGQTVKKYVFENRLRENIRISNFLFTYGDASGSYNSCYDIAYSDEYAKYPVRSIFQALFGSYNGDYDSENNILRSSIASNPSGLICYWNARPFWNTQSLSIGKSWGYITKVTQNNYLTYKHQGSDGNNLVHIALMGDPTLNFLNVSAPEQIQVEKINDIFNIKFFIPQRNLPNSPYTLVLFKLAKNTFTNPPKDNFIANKDFLWLEDNLEKLFNAEFSYFDIQSDSNQFQSNDLDFVNYYYFLSAIYLKNTPSSQIFVSSILSPFFFNP